MRCGLNLQEIYQEIEALEEKSFEKHLLEKYIECQKVSKDYLGFLLSKLVEHGYVNILNFLIKDASITTCSISAALVKAAEKGHLTIIEYLLLGGKSINKFYKDLAIKKALENGYENIACLNF